MDWAAAQERLRGPMFAPLHASLARLDPFHWPSHEALTALAGGVVTSRGIPVRFVPPRRQADAGRPYYEMHIARTGEVETRPGSWHDLFNALAWIAFPKAKAAINAQHAAILEAGGEAEAKRRSPERDALSLFDEGGVIVASSSPAMLRLLVDFEWKALFWHRREELAAKVSFIPFGHALSEKALDPFVGIVAKTVFVPVNDLFAMLPFEARVAEADALLASHFAHRARFASPKAMAPMPVMGVPGWHPGTADESFYDDRTHFRRKDETGDASRFPSSSPK
jgi:hypothetical protein